jgi:hypothetical protein
MSQKVCCRIIHPQIFWGSCPACGQVFPGGEGHCWDLPRMEKDIDGGDAYTIEIIAWSLKRVPPDFFPALPLFRKFLAVDEAQTTVTLALNARDLSDDDIASLEAAARDNPDDLVLRIGLLGYYSQRQYVSEAARQARAGHALTVIERWPRSHVAGTPWTDFHAGPGAPDRDKARAVWLQQIEANPDDPIIMGNAAKFFLIHDGARAGELLRRARDLEPDNAEWSLRIAHLYSLQKGRGDEGAGRDWAAMALAEMEKATSRDAANRLNHLHKLASEAFASGDLIKARTYSSELLEKVDQTDRGTAIFQGNRVMGLVCLAEGDIVKAKDHLIASGYTPGSPVLGSFGPEMDLAKGLLDAGEREAVIEFLRLCSRFWKMGADRLALWNETIELGKTPEGWPSKH